MSTLEQLSETNEILKCIRNSQEAIAELDKISNRTNEEGQQQAVTSVQEILRQVKQKGDNALIEYTKQFDGYNPNPLAISSDTISQAWETTPNSLKNALRSAKKRIQAFHEHQIPKNILIKGPQGETLGRKWNAVEKAGIYIPGGKASYPSTVLMNAIPALVAGVKEIIMFTPAAIDGEINKTVLAAASLVGIKKVFRIGGAQAIAAMAYGTQSVPKVNVITGPGNLYVTLAKQYVFGQVGIDSLAGPSEIIIIADNTANIKYLAADLLAQAEHDPLASAILLTTNSTIKDDLTNEIKLQLKKHPRSEICLKSLKNWGLLVICKSLEDCVTLSNHFAPEHLELLTDKPHKLLNKITNAGAIFIGPWSPEAVGDYLAGPNHTLPTCGNAKFSGALSVETFMKNSSIIEFNENAFNTNKQSIIDLANSEGLFSHGKSIEIRKSISY